jgi:hypothetical protein
MPRGTASATVSTVDSSVSLGATTTVATGTAEATSTVLSSALETEVTVSVATTDDSVPISSDTDAGLGIWPWVGLGIGLCCLVLLILLVVLLVRRRKQRTEDKKGDLGDHGLNEVWGGPATCTVGAGRASEYASTAAYLQEDTPTPGSSIVYASMPEVPQESKQVVPESGIVYASFKDVGASSSSIVYGGVSSGTAPSVTYGKFG